MLRQNEKKAMKSADVKSRVGRSRHIVVLPLRFSFPHYLWIHLVLALCSGFAAPVSTQATQGNVSYFIEVTVESTESETNEQAIIDWLQPVLERNLQTCETPGNTTTPNISSTLATSTVMSTTSEPNITNTTAANTTTSTATGAFTTTMTTSASMTTSANTTSAPASTTTTANTTSAPASTTTSPITTSAPVNTSAVTTSAPVNTTTSVVTTSAPVSTTSAVTTSAPVSTTSAVTTSALASTTTSAITTSAPASPSTTSSAMPKPDTATTGTIAGSTTTTLDVISTISDVTTVSKDKPNNTPNSNSVKRLRVARETTGLLKDFELDCVDKTSIVKTTCFVSLVLEENVDPCCILKTLCSASVSSSNFSMVWKCAGRGGLLPNQNDTCSNSSEDVCVYTEPTSPTCDAYETRPSTDSLAAANALLEMTKDASKMNSSQIDKLVSELEKLLSGPNVSLALGNTSVEIVSNLQNATPEAVDNSKNRIMGIVDTVGQKLVLRNSTESLLSEAVALSVHKADGTNFEEIYFSISNPNTVQVGSSGARAVKQESSLPQGSVKLPQNLTENLSAEERQMVSRVQFNFYQKSTLFQDKNLGKRILNSGIIGARVSNVTISGLQDNVIINLRNIQPIPANYVASCVFWDFTFNEGSGGWNSKGCSVLSSTNTETICACNHLTSFGILLDPTRGELISRVQATILTFITYIGCGISAIFLAVTLLTYLAFGKLRKDIPSKILIQLCLALLLLNLVFLVDAWLALYPAAVGLCISTAWFLHYFLLVAFTWMGLEAVHMYIALVKVFNSYISHYMVKFSLAGWGIPMIVVIIVIAIDKDNYGLVSYGKFSDGSTDEFCWIKNDIAFYVAVVAYYCVIFLFNVIMFIVVLVQLCRIKRQNPHNLQHRTTLQDVRSVLGITILLGLTWGFAFFAWGPLNLPFMYLFAIFNSLQGFFIFVFHCAIKENVRRQWRTYLCCGRMRLAENSEWSRTATQKTGKKSTMRVTSHSSKSNNSSSSSYLVSDSSEHMNGYGNPHPDHIITADEDPSMDPSMDVIFNEINNQYRHL